MSEAGQKARDRAKRIIGELRKKTQDNGCTEHEALAAAQQIGELLEKYELTMDETDVREDAASCRQIEVYAADDYAGTLVSGIGLFCTLIVYQNRAQGVACKYVMFGTPQDLEMGEYLYEVCAEAMEYEWGGYMESHGYSVKKRESFRMGFANRVYQRLKKLKAERDARRPTGTAMVLLKDALVKSEWDKVGIKLRGGREQRVRADTHAFMHGSSAGDKVNLERPLGSGVGSNPSLRGD